MADQEKFHWAQKVSRRDIQRLYESDAQGRLDEELLEKVIFAIQARVGDMVEVREAQTFGRVHCRACGALLPQGFRMGSGSREIPLACPQCSWQTTCGEYLAGYSGKDLLPGSRADLFADFLARYPAARTPQQKMLLLDWLIHSFHVHSGVSGRLVAMNVIQGSRDQLVELLTSLAAGEKGQAAKETWLQSENDPITRFRRKHASRAKVLEIAAQLGISGRTKMPERELIAEILRLRPELGQET